MKMLAVNFGGLGDEVLFLPTLKSIKLEHPDWHITLLTEPRARSVKQLTNLVDQSIVFDIKKRPLLPQDYMELIGLLRGGGYDLILSSGGSLQVSVLLFLSGINRRVGYDSGAVSRLLLSAAVPLNKEQYAGLMYHDLVKGLGITRTAANPEVVLSQESLQRMKLMLNETGLDNGIATGADQPRRVILHPGTSRLAIQKGIIKVWAAQNWVQLSQRLLAKGCHVILAGGPEDEEAVAQINAGVSALSPTGSAGKFLSALGKTANVADLAALIQLCDLMVCVDSAPMHIAAALPKPLVALFGPTDPQKLLPEDQLFIALKEDSGAPKTAPGVQIPVDTVFQTVEDLWRRVSSQDSFQECRFR